MLNNRSSIRNFNRLKRNEKFENEEEEDDQIYYLQNEEIFSFDDENTVNDYLDHLFSDDESVKFLALDYIAKFSKSFAKNLFDNLTPDHFNAFYNFLDNDKYKDFVIFIFINLCKKNDFTPNTKIFQTITKILLDVDSDDTEIINTLYLVKNLVESKEANYSQALRYNINQSIIKNDKNSPKIIKTKILAISSFLIYENHDIEEEILSYITQDEFIQLSKAGIFREIIHGFEYAMSWSYKAIQIINESNLLSISSDILISDKSKNVVSVLSFLKKCITTLEITDIQYIKSFVIVLLKEDDEIILKDILASLIIFIMYRKESMDFLYNSICEIGVNNLISTKSFSVKKLFLSFIDESVIFCPKDVMIIPPNDLGFFVHEMILTSEYDLQTLSINVICGLISSISNSGDNRSQWIQDFSQSLASFNILDIIYQSSVIYCQDVSDQIDLLSSFFGNKKTI